MIIEINQDNYETIVQQTEKLVLLDFYATWCVPCKSLIPTLEILADEYRDSVIVGKVCLDEEFTFNQEIGVQLGVMAIPNVVIFNQGKVVGKRIVGPQEQAVYREALNNILNS
jgi:thioredoxin 1